MKYFSTYLNLSLMFDYSISIDIYPNWIPNHNTIPFTRANTTSIIIHENRQDWKIKWFWCRNIIYGKKVTIWSQHCLLSLLINIFSFAHLKFFFLMKYCFILCGKKDICCLILKFCYYLLFKFLFLFSDV